MSYVGSNPITQFFLEGTDSFLVLDVDTSMFTMTRPVPTINAISVNVGTTNLLPIVTNYSVDGTTLTLVVPVRNTTVYVRYLTASNYSITPAAGSLNINTFATTGTASNLTYLRGDSFWGTPGTVSNVSLSSPASSAFSIATPATTPVISFANVGVMPTTVFLRGDGSWVAPSGQVSNVSFASPASLAFAVADPTTTPIISFSGVTAPSTQFLRGDGTWVAPTGGVSNVSFASPASLAFSVATPSSTPVISFSNVGITPSAVFLRGDGSWVAPLGAGTVTNVSFAAPASNAFSVAAPSSTPVISLANVGVTPTTVFLRGDGTWSAPTGGVSNVSFVSPASLAFSVATPGTTPAISFANVTSASTQFLRGDGSWTVPTSIVNTGGWSVAQSGTKLAFTYNGTLVASLGSNGLFTSANNIQAFGAP